MKRLTLTLLTVLLYLAVVNGQLRHVAGTSSVGIGVGKMIDGFQVNGNYHYLLKNKIGLKLNIAWEKIENELSDASLLYLNPEGHYMVGKVKGFLFFNVKGGVLIGSENTKNEFLENSKGGVVFGQNIGISSELYLCNKFSLSCDVEQRFFQKSLFGNNSSLITITLNYKL